MNKPPQIEGYFRILKTYISQKFLLAALIALSALSVLYAEAIHPVVMAKWYEMQSMPTFNINSKYMEEYTGDANLIAADGTLLYKGSIRDGLTDGFGILYSQGTVIYKGEFVTNLFEGEGELYEDGILKYRGKFAKNQFHGHGTLFENGDTKLYSGEWEDGLYEGRGKLYDSGTLKYDGEFSKGFYHGDGILYDTTTGFPIFTGKFDNGDFTLNGTHYDENGNPVSLEMEINPVEFLAMPYEKLIELLETSEISYTEKQLDEFYVVILSDDGIIIDMAFDDVPLIVKSVYLCGKLAFDNVMVGMNIEDIRTILGNPESMQPAQLNFTQTLCLNLSNLLWVRAEEANNISKETFFIHDKRMTVYSSNSVSLFFELSMTPYTEIGK